MGYTYCPTGKCATMQGCEATAGSGPASDYYCYSDYDCPVGHMCLGGECIEYAFDGPQACCTGIVLLAAGTGLGLVARAKVK